MQTLLQVAPPGLHPSVRPTKVFDTYWSGCWHTLMFHGIGTEQDGWGHISVPEFARQMAELAKYRDSGAVAVVTFRDGAEHLRHPVMV